MVLERFETYSLMNDVDTQIEKASTEANGLFEDGKLNSREYQRIIEEIASAKLDRPTLTGDNSITNTLERSLIITRLTFGALIAQWTGAKL